LLMEVGSCDLQLSIVNATFICLLIWSLGSC